MQALRFPLPRALLPLAVVFDESAIGGFDNKATGVAGNEVTRGVHHADMERNILVDVETIRSPKTINMINRVISLSHYRTTGQKQTGKQNSKQLPSHLH